jgi:hypothetical protein
MFHSICGGRKDGSTRAEYHSAGLLSFNESLHSITKDKSDLIQCIDKASSLYNLNLVVEYAFATVD